MSDYILYTDGAYSSTRNKMGIGLAFLKENKLILRYSKMFEGGTNNMAEIIAIILALKMIKQPIESLIIRTDSEYCIGCATKGWKRSKNVRLWEEFDRQYTRVSELCPNIVFEHVKGHNGDKWNEYCDKLATTASRRI